MIDLGRHNVLGVMISAVDYEAVVERVNDIWDRLGLPGDGAPIWKR